MTTKRILIIDDDQDIQTVIQIGLEMEIGWEVITANSGQEGIAKAETEQPDAILLDMMMPGMNGVTTLKQLQANSKRQCIPVIFLTAKASSDDRWRYQSIGVVGVIAKPFDSLTLAHQIAAILDWRI